MKKRSESGVLAHAPMLVALAVTPLNLQALTELNPQSVLQNEKFRTSLKQLIQSYKKAESIVAEDNNVSAKYSSTATSVEKRQNIDSELSLPISKQNEISSPSSDYDDRQVENGSRFAAGDELILGVKVGEYELPDIYAFKNEEGFRVGFALLIQLLELPIDVAQDFKSATGWIGSENNKFTYQLNEKGVLEVVANGKRFELSGDQIELMEDDLYIDLGVIASWLSFSFKVDESALKLALSSERQLPVESRLSRKSKELGKRGQQNVSVMPFRESAYTPYSTPLFDAVISGSKTNDSSSLSYSLLGSHDLAYFNTNYYLSGNKNDALNSARLTFSKESPKKELLGLLKATEFELGDVVSTGGLSGTSSNGRGVRVSNVPIQTSIDGRKVNLTGDVQNGWDVELYLNGVLIDRVFATSEGRYQFNDVELTFGRNEFEIVLYGPQGQVETKSEVYDFTENSVKGGEFSYQFSVLEANRSLIELNNKSIDSGLQSSLNVAYGLADWISVGSGISQQEDEAGNAIKSVGASVSSSLQGIASMSNSFSETDSGQQYTQHSVNTNIFGAAIGMDYSKQKNSYAAHHSAASEFDSYGARMSGRIFNGTPYALSYKNDWRKEETVTGITTSFSNSIGINTAIGSFGNSLFWREQERFLFSEDSLLPNSTQPTFVDDPFSREFYNNLPIASETSAFTAGGLQYRTNIGRMFARFFTNYTIKPEKDIVSYGTSFSYPISDKVYSNFNYFYFTQRSDYNASAGVSWRFDDFLLSANANYSKTGNWSAGLTARFGFGFDAKNAGYFMSSRQIAQSGAVSAKVYEDKNQNLTYDEGEPLVTNAKVMASQQLSKFSRTDERGVSVITALNNNIQTDIIVERDSFEDPSMMSLVPGVAIMPREGYMEHIEFPVTSTGELEGNIYLRSEDNQNQPAAYVIVQLINSSGEVVNQTQSEFDGYYLFVDVVPGTYRIALDKKNVNRRGFRNSPAMPLTITGGGILNGADFTLEQLEFVKGYAVEMGSFSSLELLKTYWMILARSGMNVALLRPFYLKDDVTEKFVLRASFVQDYDRALSTCQRIRARKLKCHVNEFEFKL